MEKLSSKEIFIGRLVRLSIDKFKLPSGDNVTREIVKHPEASAIIPVVKNGGKEKIVLVKQFRAPVDKKLWEIPAGIIEKGEKPLECAKRELMEETGLRGGRWIKLTSFYSSPGFSNEEIHLFLGYDLEYQKNAKKERNLKLREFTYGELKNWVEQGKIRDSKTLIGISLASDYQKRG